MGDLRQPRGVRSGFLQVPEQAPSPEEAWAGFAADGTPCPSSALPLSHLPTGARETGQLPSDKPRP